MALYRDKVFAFRINCAIMKYNKNKRKNFETGGEIR